MSYSVSVVIPNYNGKFLLEKNLPSIFAALKKSTNEFEVIVSDDASTDSSVAFLKEQYLQVKIVLSEINQGFSFTANKGVEVCRMNLVLLLNSDVSLQEDYFDSQWKYFEDPNTFGVMGSIWSEDGKILMDAAKYPVWKGGQLKTTINYKVKADNTKVLPSLFLSGANALVDRGKLFTLKGFDTRYSPYYMEDVDLSVRAWRSGWNCYYEPKAVCYHKLSETISAHNSLEKVKFISKRNKFIFHHTHLSGIKRILWNTENTLNFLFRWLIFDTNYYKIVSEYKKIVRDKQAKTNYPKILDEITGKILQATEKLDKELF